jgi:hypothetical protein
MDWDQIESKWAAMTRRVRCDLSINKVDATGKTQRRVTKADAKTSVGADRQVSVDSDQQVTMPTQ